MIRKIPLLILVISGSLCSGQHFVVQPVNDSICSGDNMATFTVESSSPGVSFQWQISEALPVLWSDISGLPDVSGDTTNTLLFSGAMEYTGKIFRCVLKDYFNGSVLDYSNIAEIIEIMLPNPDFNINETDNELHHTFCSGTAIKFYDLSDDTFALNNWLWDFGDGNSSLFQNPDHLYDDGGDYTISLTAWNRFGCQNTIQKSITLLPVQPLFIHGPDVICSNQYSFNDDLYYTISPYCDTCIYEWFLPENHILDSEVINDSTLRIHWGIVDEAVQLQIMVTERNTWWQCLTGEAYKEVLLIAKQAPATAYKIIRKAQTAILICLGDPVDRYRWGYTIKSSGEDMENESFVSNYCDFGNLDLQNNTYWVETAFKGINKCWTRNIFYYDLDITYNNQPEIHVYPLPVTRSTFTIELFNSFEESYKVDIYSLQGQLVYHESLNKNPENPTLSAEIRTDRLTGGIYILKVTSASGIKDIQKLIIQN